MDIKTEIEKLKVSGKIFIWRYTDNDRNYPGWNLTVDKMASQDLSQLFRLMEQCDWSTKKSVSTSQPTDKELSVPNNRQGTAKWMSKPAITFIVRKDGGADVWAVHEKKNEIEIALSKNRLQQLRDAILDVPNGRAETSIADSKQENILTFWWRLEK